MSEPDHLEATNWLEGVLTDIAKINPPVDLKGLDKDSLVTLITMADVDGNGKIVNRHIRKLSEVKSGFTRFQESDVLFAKITPCMENGKGAIASKLQNGYGFGSTEFHVLRAKESGCPGFIFHISADKKFRNKALTYFSGSAGQQRVDSEFFSKYHLEIPPRNEQRKIAKILTTVDNLIEKTEALIAKYEAIRQGMMHDLFTRGVDENGRLRPSYQEAPELYEETELGCFPKDWTILPLEDISIKIQDGTHFSPKTSSGTYRYITSKNIRFGYMNITECGWISEKEHLSIYGRCDVQFGDILLTKDGANTGNASINDLKEQFSLLSSVAMIRSDPSLAEAGYILHYLLSPWCQQRIKDIMDGNAITRLTLDKIKKFRIPVPTLREQKRIANSIDSVHRKMKTEKNISKKIESIKTALMQDLLTGKVRVPPDEETEAHV